MQAVGYEHCSNKPSVSEYKLLHTGPELNQKTRDAWTIFSSKLASTANLSRRRDTPHPYKRTTISGEGQPGRGGAKGRA